MRHVTGAQRVEIRLLGGFALLRDGMEVPARAFGGRKARTLIKVLSSRQGQLVSTDVLAAALWPDRSPADPVANLQVLVNRARHALGDPALIITGQHGYTLAPEPACAVDAQRLLRAATAGAGSPTALRATELRAALDLWQGDPLPEDAYDDWAAEFRARVFRGRRHLLEEAATLALSSGDAGRAVEMSRSAVDADPLCEPAVLLLVRALAVAGDGAGALRAFEDYRRELADELGVDPSPEAAELHRRLIRRPPAGAAPASGRGRRSFDELAFVGRERELTLIRSSLSGARRSGTVILVGGVSGAGKSRLIDTVARSVPIVRARAYAAEVAEPWALLRTLLREVLSQDMGHRAGLPTPMAATLTWLLPELDDGRLSAVRPDAENRRILIPEVATAILRAAALPIAVDDLQWCDPSSLAVLEAVVRRDATTGTVVAFRSEEVADHTEVADFLRRSDVALRVDLGGLSGESLRAVVDDRGVVAAICSQTDRTPMAVTEVLRGLSAEGLVTPSANGPWHTGPGAARRAGELALAGHRTSIGARVDAQSAPDRRLLALMALAALEVPARFLAEATGRDEQAVAESLSRLLRRGLVRAGDNGWATSHDMVTDVVAGRLDDADRIRHHADLANALGTEGDRTRLAHHRLHADDRAAASAAYCDASRRALDTFADDEAAGLADRGLALAPAAQVGALLHEVRGEARQRRGDLAGARHDLQAALSAATNSTDRARILARLAMLASGSDDIVRASHLAEFAVAEAGEHAPTRARALEVASVLDMNLGRTHRSGERAAEALSLYERLGDSGGMARVVDARAMAEFLGGDVRQGSSALNRAADLFADSGDLVRTITPRSTAGHALVFAGHAAEGLRLIDAALDLARTLGHAEGQAYALWHRAEALTELGRVDEAAADSAEALSIATRIGHRGWTATAWRATGLAARRRGDLDEALRAFGNSLALADNLGLFASWAAARIALVLVEYGKPGEAKESADRALSEGPPLGHYEARWAAAEVAAALGDTGARSLARLAVEFMAEGGVAQGRDRLLTLAGQ